MKLKYIKAILIIIAAIVFSLPFWGCSRHRINDHIQKNTIEEKTQSDSEKTNQSGDSSKKPDDNCSKTEKSKEAEPTVHSPAKLHVPSSSSNSSVNKSNSGSSESGKVSSTGTNTLPSKVGTTSGVDSTPASSGSKAGIVKAEYKKVLNQSAGSLYPCEYGNVYFELVQNYKTVNNNSADIARIISDSGGHNVACYRGDNNSIVNDSDVIGYQPAIVVKIVSPTVLGEKVTSPTAAADTVNSIKSRPGWNTVPAVISKSVIVVSEELLTSDEGKLALKLYMAKYLHPELFTSIDVNTALHRLLAESGKSTSGIYIYSE